MGFRSMQDIDYMTDTREAPCYVPIVFQETEAHAPMAKSIDSTNSSNCC